MQSSEEMDFIRRAFGRQMVGLLGEANEGLERAFGAVPREHFLGSEPWQVLTRPDGYVSLPSNDPIYAYQDVLIALARSRGVNNGSPSLHAKMMHTLAPRPGDTVAHIGAGTGYYTAILAELVGPEGRIMAIEYDAALAKQAADNLVAWKNVEVVHGDGAGWPKIDVDRIYVNFAVESPPELWIERLGEHGRLVFPLGVSGRPQSPGGPRHTIRGGVFAVTRTGSAIAARLVGPASFVCAEGPTTGTKEDRERLAAAFSNGGAEFIQSLVWKGAIDPARCWYAAAGWALSYDPPRGDK